MPLASPCLRLAHDNWRVEHRSQIVPHARTAGGVFSRIPETPIDPTVLACSTANKDALVEQTDERLKKPLADSNAVSDAFIGCASAVANERAALLRP